MALLLFLCNKATGFHDDYDEEEEDRPPIVSSILNQEKTRY
jgi:hypothetical protein